MVLKILLCSPARVPAPCGMWKDCTLLADKRYADITRNCTSYYTCHGGTYFGHNFCNPGMYHTFTEIRENVVIYLKKFLIMNFFFEQKLRIFFSPYLLEVACHYFLYSDFHSKHRHLQYLIYNSLL